MIRIDRPVIVEGKYDKIKLSSIIEATIIVTNGFQIFSDKEKLNFIRKISEKNGVIILTDSDWAGLKIRNYLKGSINPNKIIHVYIPDVYGKEKRKFHSSKEGKLGVEGIKIDLLIEAFTRAGVINQKDAGSSDKITKLDFYNWGLSGQANSSTKRREVTQALGFPENLSSNALLEAVNEFYTRENFLTLMQPLM